MKKLILVLLWATVFPTLLLASSYDAIYSQKNIDSYSKSLCKKNKALEYCTSNIASIVAKRHMNANRAYYKNELDLRMYIVLPDNLSVELTKRCRYLERGFVMREIAREWIKTGETRKIPEKWDKLYKQLKQGKKFERRKSLKRYFRVLPDSMLNSAQLKDKEAFIKEYKKKRKLKLNNG